MTEKARASFRRRNPLAIHPRRIVPHMAGVSALEFGDPVAAFVWMEPNDSCFHTTAPSSYHRI
jgi:hypothetical protein